MIDMHAHWRPAALADALRARTGEEPLAAAFDDVDVHLARMDRQGVSTSVLSLLGSFCWIEAQPLDVSARLCRLVNDHFSELCQEPEGVVGAYPALPVVDL